MQQGDLFGGDGPPSWPAQAPAGQPSPEAVPPEALSDAALLAAIQHAGRGTCHALAEEAVRRRLPGTVAALQVLCRRLKGFGRHRAPAEQIASLRALAAIGGAEAAEAVRRIVTDGVVADPGMNEALQAAAGLRCILPEPVALPLLRHPEPEVRALACRCAPRTQPVATVLASLLDDLHPAVANAAAIALGHRGLVDGRSLLLHLLQQAPTADLIAALAGVADEASTVLIGRLARQRPDLRAAALSALDAIDTPRAAALLESLGNRDESRALG